LLEHNSTEKYAKRFVLLQQRSIYLIHWWCKMHT